MPGHAFGRAKAAAASPAASLWTWLPSEELQSAGAVGSIECVQTDRRPTVACGEQHQASGGIMPR